MMMRRRRRRRRRSVRSPFNRIDTYLQERARERDRGVVW